MAAISCWISDLRVSENDNPVGFFQNQNDRNTIRTGIKQTKSSPLLNEAGAVLGLN
jgi:hypothetical protein